MTHFEFFVCKCERRCSTSQHSPGWEQPSLLSSVLTLTETTRHTAGLSAMFTSHWPSVVHHQLGIISLIISWPSDQLWDYLISENLIADNFVKFNYNWILIMTSMWTFNKINSWDFLVERRFLPTWRSGIQDFKTKKFSTPPCTNSTTWRQGGALILSSREEDPELCQWLSARLSEWEGNLWMRWGEARSFICFPFCCWRPAVSVLLPTSILRIFHWPAGVRLLSLVDD